MAEVKTVQTKHTSVKSKIEWGKYRPRHSGYGSRSELTSNELTLKATYNVIKKEIGIIQFSTKKDGKVLEVPDLGCLLAMQELLDETIVELKKLVFED